MYVGFIGCIGFFGFIGFIGFIGLIGLGRRRLVEPYGGLLELASVLGPLKLGNSWGTSMAWSGVEGWW